MTRDRFIKLLMARGVEIRRARYIASKYNAWNVPYSEAYSDYLARQKVPAMVRQAFYRLGEAAEKLGNSFQTLQTAFEKFNRNLQRSQEK